MTETVTTAADAVHWLAIDADWGEPRLKLVCTATRGAYCRKRHPDPDVEEWLPGDPGLIDTDRCWAVEWAEDAGWESVQVEEGAEFPPIPVSVTCDEGPMLAPILPHPTLPEPERVKPSREDVARVIVNHSGQLGTHYMDVALAAADAVLALLPGRTEAKVKAEALEEAADSLVVWGVLAANSLHVSSVRSWLRHRAAALLRGESHG